MNTCFRTASYRHCLWKLCLGDELWWQDFIPGNLLQCELSFNTGLR